MMKTLIFTIALFGASPAWSTCYADYKAKQDSPLRLHYGVAELSDADCSNDAARTAIQTRISNDGWQLLNVISVFDQSGLDQRRAPAGEYFLRY